MSGGSMMWSSTLIKIMSSLFTTRPFEWLRSSGGLRICPLPDSSTNFEVDDVVPTEAEFRQDLIAMLVEFGCPCCRCRCPIVLNRRRNEPERLALRCHAILEVAVGDGLLVCRGLSRVLHHRPLPGEIIELEPPFIESPL